MKQSLDFIVIGAQKSGTTSLFEYLRPHPELFLPSGKEAPFYSDDSSWHDGWSEYVRRYFALATDEQRWGTVTPQYMYGSLVQAADRRLLDKIKSPERLVPERIASHSPDARLIAILRDPLERAYSHYRMECFRGAELRTFEVAIDALLDPKQLEQSRRQPTEVTAYITNGEYGRILAPYFELFGKDRVLVCFARDLDAEPDITLRSILQFLGVAADFQPPNLGQRYRVAASRRRVPFFDMDQLQRRVSASRRFRSSWHALPAVIRERIDWGFKELQYQLDVRNRVVEQRAQAPLTTIHKRLRLFYATDQGLLRTLIGRDPPW